MKAIVQYGKDGDMEDIRVRLSALWVFAALNYLWGDVMQLFTLVGSSNAPHMTQEMVLGFSVVVEIPIVMSVLSRMLKPRANRWANMAAGTLLTAVALATTIANPTVGYLFFGSLEMACTALIVWCAWRWPGETAKPA